MSMDKLQDKIERIEDHDMEAITFFIDYYMKSDCLTIHELVRREENKLLIQNGKIIVYLWISSPRADT